MTSGKRVLLVEDFDDSRIGLAKLLKVEGYEVLEARDGAQAIELALAQTPDIILMDLSLPIVDGATASRRIKESTNSIPIVALTAHEEEDVRGSVDPDDYVAFVTKPVSFSRLLAVLSAQLSGRR